MNVSFSQKSLNKIRLKGRVGRRRVCTNEIKSWDNESALALETSLKYCVCLFQPNARICVVVVIVAVT